MLATPLHLIVLAASLITALSSSSSRLDAGVDSAPTVGAAAVAEMPPRSSATVEKAKEPPAKQKASKLSFPKRHFRFDCGAKECDATGTAYWHEEKVVPGGPPDDRKKRWYCSKLDDKCKACGGTGLDKEQQIQRKVQETARLLADHTVPLTLALRDQLAVTLADSVDARESTCKAPSGRHPGARARHAVLADRLESMALSRLEKSNAGEPVYLVLKTPGSAAKCPDYADDNGTILVTGSPYGDLALVSPFGLEFDQGLRYLVFATKGPNVDRSGKSYIELNRVIAVPFPRM